MPDALWWVQVVGGLLTALLASGGVVTALYSVVRGTPQFIRRATGVDAMETKIDQLLADHETSRQLQLQQAEAFNDLTETVCEEHDIPPEERPTGMSTTQIRRQLLDQDHPDFKRDSPSSSCSTPRDRIR